jgi:hypothetical protein
MTSPPTTGQRPDLPLSVVQSTNTNAEPVPKPKPGSLVATLFGPTQPKPDEVSRLYVHSWITRGAKNGEQEKIR